MKNWKTTLLGALAGCAMFFGQYTNARLADPKSTPPITAGNVLPALAITLLGAFAKDRNVTGGTVDQ